MSSFDYVLNALRIAQTDADEKIDVLGDFKDEIVSALSEIDNYKDRIQEAIDAIESLDDLSCSYSFDISVDDINLYPEF